MPMKITFVAHEFGIYPSHGGIAAYLLQIVRYLLANCADCSVDVICEVHGSTAELLAVHPGRFTLHEIRGAGDTLRMRRRVREILATIQPDIVEAADYLGLVGLAALDRQLGLDFPHTTFVTNHHTASQEIFEWCTDIDAAVAPPDVRRLIMHERDQMHLVDANIAPSRFLAAYVERRYALPVRPPVFPYPYVADLQTRDQLRRAPSWIDPQAAERRFTVLLLSRFEPRKNQARLVREFTRFLRLVQARGESALGIDLHMAGNSVPMGPTGMDYRQFVFDLVPSDLRPHVHFHDFLRLDQQGPLIAGADLAVMPSTFENFPIAMIETVLRGIPVMGSRYSGVADYCVRDADLLTFDPRAEGELARNLLTFLDRSPAQRADILDRQQRELDDLLAPDNSVHARIAYCRSVCVGPPARPAAPTVSLRVLPNPAADDPGAIDAHASCGTVARFLAERFPDAGHLSFCLASGRRTTDRLNRALSGTFASRLGESVIAFTCDGHFPDLLAVLDGGFPLCLPHVPLTLLAQAPAETPVHEPLLSEALARRLIVDPTAATRPEPVHRPYRDACFFLMNRIIATRIGEIA